MDNPYWKDVYLTKDIPQGASDFARFVTDTLKGEKLKFILDLGCGNGRDSYYLQDFGTVIGVDLATQPPKSYNASFMQTSMDNLNDTWWDLIYMRFSLHSVPEEIEEKVLDYAMRNAKYIAIEARSTSDKLSNGQGENNVETSYASKHYRRYIDKNKLVKKIKDRGFNVMHVSESDKYAKYKDTSPMCVRLIASIT